MQFVSRRGFVAASASSLLLLSAYAPPASAQAAQAAHEIVHLLKATFDRAEAPLSVEPVVIVGDHAVAGWSQEGRGGRALMRKVKDKWTIHLCSGDSLRHAAVLKDTGVPEAQAAELAKTLATEEAKLPKDKVALFGTFQGTVMIGPDGHHPPTEHGAHAPPAGHHAPCHK